MNSLSVHLDNKTFVYGMAKIQWRIIKAPDPIRS